MKADGRHLLVEYRGCNNRVLDDTKRVEELMHSAARASGARVVGAVFHRFSPQGVSGVVVIEESHLSIHTWPEYGYAAVDFFTCGDCQPEPAHEVLLAGLEAKESESMLVHRGALPGSQSMRVLRHETADGKQGGDGVLVRRAI